jgi:hypothetical protein
VISYTMHRLKHTSAGMRGCAVMTDHGDVNFLLRRVHSWSCSRLGKTNLFRRFEAIDKQEGKIRATSPARLTLIATINSKFALPSNDPEPRHVSPHLEDIRGNVMSMRGRVDDELSSNTSLSS